MVGPIQPQAASDSTHSLGKFKKPRYNPVDEREDIRKPARSEGKVRPDYVFDSTKGPEIGSFPITGSMGLSAEVSDLRYGHEMLQVIPQLILVQRGYQAAIKTFRSKDENLTHTIDIVA